MTAIRTFFQEFWNRIPQIGVNDIIDILIVAFLFYTVMRLIRSTSAARIARSILRSTGFSARFWRLASLRSSSCSSRSCGGCSSALAADSSRT